LPGRAGPARADAEEGGRRRARRRCGGRQRRRGRLRKLTPAPPPGRTRPAEATACDGDGPGEDTEPPDGVGPLDDTGRPARRAGGRRMRHDQTVTSKGNDHPGNGPAVSREEFDALFEAVRTWGRWTPADRGA